MSFGLVGGNTDHLFCKVDWYSVCEHRRRSFLQDVDRYDGNRLLNTSTDDLAAYFSEKHKFDVPSLQEEAISADQREAQIDISQDPMRYIRDRSRPVHVTGTLIEVEVPYSGDQEVFFIQPTKFSMNPPRAKVVQGKLVLRVQGVDLDAATVKPQIDRTLGEIREHLERLRQTASEFNQLLFGQAVRHIEERKRKLLADRNLVANLGFALKARDGGGKTYVAPEVRRKMAPVPPKASTVTYKPEPVMSNDDYENILNLMEGMVRVMECSPSDFSHMREETLRSHFLVQLNAQYDGQATGETFNYEGKTDILVRSGGKNIFIGECKFWKGPKKFLETIDQLLGYLSWRDTKAAVVVFNQNKGFSKVLAEIEVTTPSHPNCKKLLRKRSESSWVYKFAHRDDSNREMTVTIIAFDVPSAEAKASGA